MRVLKTITIACLLLIPTTAFADSFFLQPTNATHDESGLVKFYYEVDAGETIEDTLLVQRRIKQKDKAIANAELFGVDASMSSNGFLSMSPETVEQQQLGAWISFDEKSIEVGEKAEMGYKIEVPKNATPGQYVGGMVLVPYDPEEKENEEAGSKVRLRYATTMLVEVRGEFKPSYELSEFTHSIKDGKLSVTFNLNNTGNVIYTAGGTMTLNGLYSSKTIEIPNRNILPGKSANITLEHDKMHEFLFYSNINVNFEIAHEINDELKTETINNSNSIYHFPLLAIAVLALLFGLIYVIMGRLVSVLTEKWVPHKVGKGETLFTIADAHRISWKKLAKKNGIRPPFKLSKGQEILIPLNKDSDRKNSTNTKPKKRK